MLLKNEEQKRDPKIGKKYIILIYKRIREGVQIPLFLTANNKLRGDFLTLSPHQFLKSLLSLMIYFIFYWK